MVSRGEGWSKAGVGGGHTRINPESLRSNNRLELLKIFNFVLKLFQIFPTKIENQPKNRHT